MRTTPRILELGNMIDDTSGTLRNGREIIQKRGLMLLALICGDASLTGVSYMVHTPHVVAFPTKCQWPDMIKFRGQRSKTLQLSLISGEVMQLWMGSKDTNGWGILLFALRCWPTSTCCTVTCTSQFTCETPDSHS